MLETYENKFAAGVKQSVQDYPTQEEAEAVAESLGGSGSNHTQRRRINNYMPVGPI